MYVFIYLHLHIYFLYTVFISIKGNYARDLPNYLRKQLEL